eukprot:scpid16866/ scgid30305/ Sister chromatid cohesion protein PDS5 homolog B; Androgen-induced proliferation inhibitor
MATTRSKGQKSQGAYPSLAGKVETSELLRRLKACGQSLTKTDQDQDKADRRGSELERVARELVSPQILQHADRTVRLVAACCLSDVLRIFAPEPPYTATEKQEVLELFVKSLHVLANREAKDFSRAYYLLENISIVKLFLLCMELDDADDLISSVFRLFFEIVDENHSIKIRTYFLDILSGFIVEQETMPQPVLDSILMQLTEEMQVSPAAGALSRELLQKCSSCLEPYIQQYFNRALLVGKSSESDLGDSNMYELIFELNQAAPSVLLSVLPQLEFKLKSTDKEEREEVARLLARMFASPDSSLAEENGPLWRCWLGRFRDIVPAIRCICVQFSKYFLVYHPSLAHETEAALEKAAFDPDESVRSTVVVTLQETALQDINCMTDKLWALLQKRLLDKKVTVRLDTMTTLANIYHTVHLRCLNKSGDRADKQLLKRLAWIPNKIFQLYYQPTAEDSLGVERSLHMHLVPVTASDEQRLQLLLNIYTILDDIAMRAFNEMVKKRETVRRGLVDLLAAYKAADKPRCAAQCIHLAKNLPDTSKAHDHLKQFVGMLKNRNLYDGLVNCTNMEKGCESVRKAVLGVSKEVQEINVKAVIVPTLKALLDRAAPLLVDSGFVSLLLRRVASDVDFAMNDDSDSDSSEDSDEECDDGSAGRGGMARRRGAPQRRSKRKDSAQSGQLPLACKRGLQLVMAFSVQYPVLFQMQEVYEQLLSFLKHDSPFVVESALFILMSVGGDVEKAYPSIASCLGPILKQLAIKGTPRQAKFSLRCLQKLLSNSSALIDQVLQNYVKDLSYDKDNLLTVITGLGHVALLAPTLFAPHQKTVIRNFLVKHLLVKDREGRGFREKDPEWSDDNRVSRETFLKISSLKLLVRWLSALPAEEEASSSAPVLRLLHCMLQNEGDLNAHGKTVAWEKSRLRLCAACCLLKVASMERFCTQVDSDMFLDLSLMVQDSCLQVRTSFTNKLQKWLSRMVLPVSYLSMLALAAPDPVKDQKNRMRHNLNQSIASRRDLVKTNTSLADKVEVILPEYAVPFLIHLLAHHPDLQEQTQDCLAQLKDYLWFFLEPPMLRGDTYGFLKKMIETIKQTKDVSAPTDPAENEAAQKRLYVVCDIALGLMANRVTHFTSEPFPGRIVIPRRIFEGVAKDAPLNTNKYLPPAFSFSPVGKKKLMDTGASSVSKATAGSVSSKETTKTEKTSSKSRTAPALPASSRPSRSAKSAATMQLLSAADRDSSDDNDDEDDEEEDDSGNESEGDEAMELVDSKDVFSSSAEPSSESQDTRSPEREESAPAKGGRSRALKQTTLTGSVVTGSSRRGGGARSQQRQDSSENRIRSPTKPTSRRGRSPTRTPAKAAASLASGTAAKVSTPVTISPVASENAATMAKLNSSLGTSAAEEKTKSPKKSTKAAPAGAKRSLAAELKVTATDRDEEEDATTSTRKKAHKAAPASPGKRKRGTNMSELASVDENDDDDEDMEDGTDGAAPAETKSASSPQAKRARAAPKKTTSAAAATSGGSEDSGVRVPNVKRASTRRR